MGWNCVGSSKEGRESVNRRFGCGANIEYVPVPVLDESVQSESLRCVINKKIPVRAVFTVLEDVADKIKVLIFFVLQRIAFDCS
jgi:hypothetical protein